MRIYFSLSLIFFTFISFAQFSVSGKVTDAAQQPLVGAYVNLSGKQSLTDINGDYVFSELSGSTYTLTVSYIGYVSYEIRLQLSSDQVVNIELKVDAHTIEKIVIEGYSKSIDNKQRVSSDYIQQSFSGSLAQTLENTPGINVMHIGSGTGKPVIRGLGFNRVAVSLNSNKYEGQQWGADHGLEIDAFSLESVELIKGVASIEYGSDAIGGVLKIKNNLIPEKHSFEGKLTLLGRSVNNTLGTAFELKERKDAFFYKIKGLYLDYGDYNTPTDTIIYLTRKIPIHNRRLKNTAGEEWNIFGQMGYVQDNYHTLLTLSNNRTKAGFFPGSHGIPDLDRLQDDGDSRNIDYPYQSANHFMLQNEHQWKFTDAELALDLAFQNNHRQERSAFHTHYSNQLPPENNADIELDFNLNTISTNAKYSYFYSEKHTTDIGLQLQFQDNTISGYNFLLPEYNRENYGLFALHNYRWSNKIRLNVGARYDFSAIKTASYYDQVLYEYLIGRNYTEAIAQQYAQRSPELSRNLGNFNLKAGALYSLNTKIDFNLNIGSSFRNPTPIELGANGVHHGSFRHEQGDAQLDAEKGYVVDVQANYKTDNFSFKLSPYLYYFSNYIYLKPTGTFSVLPHSGQIYKYSQTEALLTGFEFETAFAIDAFAAEWVVEYIYNRQIGENYPLPFTPPLNVFTKLDYRFLQNGKTFKQSNIYLTGKYFATQNRIARNEEVTPWSMVFGTGIATDLKLGKRTAHLSIAVQNIFDTKYFSHLSFYRSLEIPEQGRNIQLMIQFPF
ncbi:MAG TPA: TonB-dependent receptor [Flavobacterium sp.]|nr:TonB-dependent receptor [Flavobacterium sp.]